MFLRIQLYTRLQALGDYSQSKYETLKFYYVGDYDRNFNSGPEGQRFRNQIWVGFFFIKPQLKSFPNEEMLSCFKKRDNIHTQIHSQI